MNTVVLLSGGMDSAICLMWARERWAWITALSIDYGQTHSVELKAAARIAKLAGVGHDVMKLPLMNPQGVGESTWLPGRNLVFLSLASTYLPSRIVTGVCQSDDADYPDCRQEFITCAEVVISKSIAKHVELLTPLMNMSKGESILMAQRIPLAWEAIGMSVTCYKGTQCGTCPACEARAAGFLEAGKADPAL